MNEDTDIKFEDSDIVVEITSDENGMVTYSRRRVYTTYCRTEKRRLYRGRNYQRALDVAETHVDDNPRHVVTVIGNSG